MAVSEENTDGSLRHKLWCAFVEGATLPSLAALVMAGTIVVAVFATVLLTVSSEILAGPTYRYFLVDGFDSSTISSHRALSIEPSEEAKVIVLGTSVAVTCIVDQDEFAPLIAAHGVAEPTVYNFTTNSQSPWEMAAFVEPIPNGSHGVLVIALTPGILSFGIDDSDHRSLATILEKPKLGFTSPAIDDESRRAGLNVPMRTGFFALDNSYYFLAHRHNFIRNLFHGPPKEDADPLAADWIPRVNNEAFWQTELDTQPHKEKRYSTNSRANFDVIQRFVEGLMANSSFKVIVMESPVNPKWQANPDFSPFFAKYRGDLVNFSDRNGYRFFAVTEAAGLEPIDFVDMEGHLGQQDARAACSGAVAKAVAEELGT